MPDITDDYVDELVVVARTESKAVDEIAAAVERLRHAQIARQQLTAVPVGELRAALKRLTGH